MLFMIYDDDVRIRKVYMNYSLISQKRLHILFARIDTAEAAVAAVTVATDKSPEVYGSLHHHLQHRRQHRHRLLLVMKRNQQWLLYLLVPTPSIYYVEVKRDGVTQEYKSCYEQDQQQQPQSLLS